MKKSNLSQNLFLILFMLVGLALLGAGIYNTVDRNKKMNTYETVRGRIVDYKEREGENGTVYGAVYAYTVDGQEYIIYDDVFSNKFPQIGERVQIMYDPADPENAFSKNGVSSGFFLILLGGMFFAIPLFVFITSNCNFSGKWAEASQGFVGGLIFAVLGYGLCFGLKQGINAATIFCFLFGSLGVYFMGYSVYNLFKPKKKNVDSLENVGLQKIPYYTADEQLYQEAVPTMQLQEEHREKVGLIRNKVRVGINIAGEINRIIVGLIFSAVGGFMLTAVLNPNMAITGMSRGFVALFLGVFVVIGLFQVFKGIKALIKK